MKYLGSKNRIAKNILPIILEERKDNQLYIEPFVGGANIIDKVDGKRIGYDNNRFVIALLKEFQNYWTPPDISREYYNRIKNDTFNTPDEIVGWAGICCSYSGKWFGGYAGKVNTKTGITRDYQAEALRNMRKQAEKLRDVEFICQDYRNIDIPEDSVVYCDPPYSGTTGYACGFDSDEFWEWCTAIASRGIKIFVSEYEAPSEWKCVWKKEVKSSLSANGKSGGSKKSIEKLFTM